MKNIEGIIMERLHCTKNDAAILCDNLKKLDTTLVPILHRWVETNDASDATMYHSYSIDSLCTDYSMNFVAALLTLNWIIKEPDIAVPALKEGIM